MLSHPVDLESTWDGMQDYGFISVLDCYKIAYTMPHRLSEAHFRQLHTNAIRHGHVACHMG